MIIRRQRTEHNLDTVVVVDTLLTSITGVDQLVRVQINVVLLLPTGTDAGTAGNTTGLCYWQCDGFSTT